jgi:hypothetical protein
MNATIFEGYLHDLQDTIANTWRITPEVVAHYQGIANFKATRHAMWIQARKDPNKNGYNCATASQRGTYKWPLRIGKTNGGFQSSLEKYPQK